MASEASPQTSGPVRSIPINFSILLLLIALSAASGFPDTPGDGIAAASVDLQAFTVQGMPASGTYWTATTLPLTIEGPENTEVIVSARLAADETVTESVIGRATIPAGQTSVAILAGGPSSEAGPLPDEASVILTVEWVQGETSLDLQDFPAFRVDTRGPRFVNALAPAGDFYADLPDPATLAFTTPEQATQVSFYGTNAFDFDGTTTGDSPPIEYRIKIWRREADASLTLLYEQPWQSGNLPVATAAIGATESFSGSLTVARGHYPRNVWSRSGSNLRVHRGNGEYVWALEAKDPAGNTTTSSPCDLWVPYAGESLWCNIYDDHDTRLRAAIWMPKDHLVPADGSQLNGEWSPYVDHPLVNDTSSVAYKAQASWAPMVFRGTAEERNRQFAEYIWKHGRLWQVLFDNYAAELEREGKMPAGAAFAPYYPNPILRASDRLRPHYSTLADGRLRVELFRDPTITEKMLYNQWEAVRDGLLAPADQYDTAHRKFYRSFGESEQSAATFLDYNVLSLIQDWSGFDWLWHSPGWNLNDTATAYEDTTYWVGNYPPGAGETAEDHKGTFSSLGLQLEAGGPSYMFLRTAGSGGYYTSSRIHSMNLPDPLESYLDLQDWRGKPEPNSYSATQKFMQRRGLFELLNIRLNDGSTGQFSILPRSFPLFEFVDPRYAGPGSEPSPVRGAPAGHFWQIYLQDNFPLQNLNSTASTWAYQGSMDAGHAYHELSHALCAGHESTMNRGPETGIGWVMEAEFRSVFGMYQTCGFDPLRSGGSYFDPLLGLPEVDVKLQKVRGSAPTVGWTAMAHFSPPNLSFLLCHPVLHVWKSRMPGQTVREEVDPVGRAAWPRDGSYNRFGDLAGPVPIGDFPTVYSIVQDYGTNPSGIASAGIQLAYRTDHDSPYRAVKSGEQGYSERWLPPDLRVFSYSPQDIGYFDTSVDVPLTPQWIFRYPGPALIKLEISDWAGNVGANAFDAVEVLFDHDKDIDSGGPSHDQIRYVAAGYPAGTTGGNGSLSTPYLSIDYAIQMEMGGERVFVLLPGEHLTEGIGGQTPSGTSKLPDYQNWFFFGGGASPADVVLRPAQPNIVLFDFAYDTDPAHDDPYGFDVMRAYNVVIGNMTLRGDAPGGGAARKGIDIGHSHGVHLANLVIKGMTEDGIKVDWGQEEGTWITNNTIVDCARGITVDNVWNSRKSDSHRANFSSYVENNLLVHCSEYAIKIGSNNSPFWAEAWNPFDNAFGDGIGGNPIVPVTYNAVYKCGESAPGVYDPRYAFRGDDWYRSDTFNAQTTQNPNPLRYYGPVADRTFLGTGNRVFQELWLDDAVYTEADLFQNYAAGDYRPANESPLIGAGSPYRLDKIKGTGGREDVLLRRSVGALLPTESQAHEWIYENTLNGSTMGRYYH